MVDICSSPLIPPLPLARPRHLNLPPMACNDPALSPSPLLRDVGSNSNATTHLRSEDDQHPPPLSKGMWAVFLMLDFLDAWQRNRGMRNARGDPRSGRPQQYVLKMNHDESHGSFSPFLHSFHPTDHPCTQHYHSEQWPDWKPPLYEGNLMPV